MQSKTSFFNRTIFRKTVSRFWPLWAAHLVIWIIILPIPLLMLFIAIGEIISCYVLGEILLTLLARYRGRIFRNRTGKAE